MVLLTFDQANYLSNQEFRRNQDQQVDVVRQTFGRIWQSQRGKSAPVTVGQLKPLFPGELPSFADIPEIVCHNHDI